MTDESLVDEQAQFVLDSSHILAGNRCNSRRTGVTWSHGLRSSTSLAAACRTLQRCKCRRRKTRQGGTAVVSSLENKVRDQLSEDITTKRATHGTQMTQMIEICPRDVRYLVAHWQLWQRKRLQELPETVPTNSRIIQAVFPGIWNRWTNHRESPSAVDAKPVVRNVWRDEDVVVIRHQRQVDIVPPGTEAPDRDDIYAPWRWAWTWLAQKRRANVSQYVWAATNLCRTCLYRWLRELRPWALAATWRLSLSAPMRGGVAVVNAWLEEGVQECRRQVRVQWPSWTLQLT